MSSMMRMSSEWEQAVRKTESRMISEKRRRIFMRALGSEIEHEKETVTIINDKLVTVNGQKK